MDRHDLAGRVLGKFAVWSTIYTSLLSGKDLWLVAELVTQVPADSVGRTCKYVADGVLLGVERKDG